MIRLRQSTAGGELVHEVDQPEIILGRANRHARTDLDFGADTTTSRTHARIWRDADGYWIEDLNSRHGTFVNGIRLTYARRLNLGDLITAGQTSLVVESLSTSQRASQTPPGPSHEPEVTVEHALNVEESALTPAPGARGQAAEELHFLLELPNLFDAQPDLESLLRVVVERVVKVIPAAERGALLLADAAGTLLVRAAVPAAYPSVSRTLAHRAFSEARAFVWRHSALRRDPSESLVQFGTQTGMYAPIVWKDRVLGVLSVDSTHRQRVFSEGDLRLLMAVAHYAALAIAAHRRSG